MWWLHRLLVLYAFARSTGAEFVPACYVDRSADVVSTGDKPRPLVEINFTVPYDVKSWSIASHLVPRHECCPTGKWGLNCDRDCECVNGGTCHSWDGSCRCPKAWTGTTCDLEKPHVEAEVNQTDVYVGNPVAIRCFPYSIDAHERNVTWRLNGNKIFEGSWSLDIPSSKESDTGIYTCDVLDNAGEIYRDSVDIIVLGCRPGWRGPDCKVPCEDCLNNGTCDRYLGCVCGEDWKGDRCEQPVCPSTVHPQLCEKGEATIAWAVGGGITFLVAVVVATFVVCYRRPCPKTTITMESHLHVESLKSEDVGDLVRHKTRLVSEDLGVLLAHWEMEESMLYIGKQLDEGSFSSVSAGHILRDNTLYNVAVKILKDERDTVSWANFMGEFRILSHVCPHQNIVQLVGLCAKSVLNQEVTCLVLEHLAIGALYKVLYENRKPDLCDNFLAPKHYVNIVLDILSGMAHLEELRFVHRDLAARNILLTESLVAKVSDFGLARDAYSTGDYRLEGARGKKLPWKWMAFESLKDGVCTSKSDIWSFGVLLWEVVTLGASPYPGVSNEELLSHLETGKRLERPCNCSTMWYAAMKTCWLEDPDDRPSFKDFLPFFREHFLLPEAQSPFADKPATETEDVMFESLPYLINRFGQKTSGPKSGAIDVPADGDVIGQRSGLALENGGGDDVIKEQLYEGSNLNTFSYEMAMASTSRTNCDEMEMKWRNTVL